MSSINLRGVVLCILNFIISFTNTIKKCKSHGVLPRKNCPSNSWGFSSKNLKFLNVKIYYLRNIYCCENFLPRKTYPHEQYL